MKRKNAQTKTVNAVTLMAVEKKERVVFSCCDFIYNNIMNKQIEQIKMYLMVHFNLLYFSC